MTLAERLAEHVRACFTGIWISSHEHQDALAEIAELCRREDWRLVTWDIDQGLSVQNTSAGRVESGSKESRHLCPAEVRAGTVCGGGSDDGVGVAVGAVARSWCPSRTAGPWEWSREVAPVSPACPDVLLSRGLRGAAGHAAGSRNGVSHFSCL